MAFVQPNFKDITMQTQTVQCHIGLARFNGNFRRAQIWFDQAFVKKMEPVVPYRTGQFLSRLKARNAARYGMGEIVVSVPPQGRKLYLGINPKTGQPWHWTNPLTQPMWGTYTYETYKADFLNGIRHVIATGRYPDGG